MALRVRGFGPSKVEAAQTNPLYPSNLHFIKSIVESGCLAVWPDLAIYWTLGKFLKHLATINNTNTSVSNEHPIWMQKGSADAKYSR